MVNKPEKKPVWQYAKEARERKAAAAAAAGAPPAETPKKVKVSKEKPTLEPEKLIISTPDVDFNAPVIPMKLMKRAGVKTYADEVKERLLDVAEAPDGAYFLLPLKLPKKVYKLLLEGTAKMSMSSPEWTERDMIEAILLFSDLTKVKNKA